MRAHTFIHRSGWNRSESIWYFKFDSVRLWFFDSQNFIWQKWKISPASPVSCRTLCTPTVFRDQASMYRCEEKFHFDKNEKNAPTEVIDNEFFGCQSVTTTVERNDCNCHLYLCWLLIYQCYSNGKIVASDEKWQQQQHNDNF